jgi:2-dehydropantoate 2-reductase
MTIKRGIFMNVGIVGAGSIGLMFAFYLNNVFKVTLYTHTAEQSEVINRNGLLLKIGEEQFNTVVRAVPFSERDECEELLIIAVKQHQLEAVINNLSSSKMPNKLFFIQNGMGHIELLEKVHAENIYVGSVEHGALKQNAFTVCQNGVGLTKAAVFKGDPKPLQTFISKFPKEFPIEFTLDYYQMLLHKLIINAAINPLTAILGVKNGELVENEFFLRALKRLVEEIISILCLGQSDDYFEQVVSVCKNTAENRSSMLSDIEAKRSTEVETILGFLLKKAAKKEKKAPQLTSLYYLVKGKENAGRESF